MAYSKNNLACLDVPMFNGAWHMWVYRSTDAIADVNTNGYITDAYEMGMKKLDVVFVIDTTNSLAHICFVANAPTSASPGGDLTNGLDITATNSD